jgi:hypothetical protein
MLLSQVHGEGRVTFRALRSAGFETLSSVAEAPVQKLSEQAHLSMQTARRLKAGAEDMMGKGIGLVERAEPDPAPRRGRVGRALRTAQAGSLEEAGPRRFSEGISLEEAALLGQGIEVLLVEESIFEDDLDETLPHVSPAILDPVPSPSAHAPAIAAAAELAASLPRVADSPAVPSATGAEIHPVDDVALPATRTTAIRAEEAEASLGLRGEENGTRASDSIAPARLGLASFWTFG